MGNHRCSTECFLLEVLSSIIEILWKFFCSLRNYCLVLAWWIVLYYIIILYYISLFFLKSHLLKTVPKTLCSKFSKPPNKWRMICCSEGNLSLSERKGSQNLKKSGIAKILTLFLQRLQFVRQKWQKHY